MFGHDHDKDHNEDNQQPSDNNDWQHPGTPLDDNQQSSATDSDDSQNDNQPAPAEEPATSEPSHSEPPKPAHSADDLIDLKQQALTKLSPLVGHLDQSADGKFKTLMMMIQASDDQSLVKEAYDTALKIDDEKERAQALLDIVNEINYFTQNPAKS